MEETNDLLKRLQDSKDLESLTRYLDKIEKNKPLSLNEFLKSLMKEKNASASELIKKSLIERTYFYQILNGRKKPGRDKLIAFALALSLSLSETQKLLVLANEGILYVKSRRDSVIIFALNHKLSVLDTNCILTKFSETELK